MMPQQVKNSPENSQTSVFFYHREKDMDHAIRIPEMGVSKVIVSTLAEGIQEITFEIRSDQMMWPF